MSAFVGYVPVISLNHVNLRVYEDGFGILILVVLVQVVRVMSDVVLVVGVLLLIIIFHVLTSLIVHIYNSKNQATHVKN